MKVKTGKWVILSKSKYEEGAEWEIHGFGWGPHHYDDYATGIAAFRWYVRTYENMYFRLTEEYTIYEDEMNSPLYRLDIMNDDGSFVSSPEIHDPDDLFKEKDKLVKEGHKCRIVQIDRIESLLED